MSLLDKDYDFDAIESMIDFKVKWHDPINHNWGKNDTAIFNLPKDIIYRNDGNILKLYIGLIDKNVLRDYITKLKEYCSIFSNRVLEDGDNPFYNHFGCYEVKVQISKDNIIINYISDINLLDYHPRFNFILDNCRMIIRGALENDIFYNVLCEIEKGLE